jgi:non-canonical purine NTP pyrophosphatase (RdgB/HAM1 family)
MVNTEESYPIFITGNSDKLKEFEEILEIKLTNKKIDLIEIQSTDVEAVTIHKVKEAYKLLKKPVIIEDTGLYIYDINNFPGALIKFYMRDLGCEGICKFHAGSYAYAETVIGYHNGNTIKLFKGVVKGKIACEPRGKNGFGWDKVFIPNNQQNKTYAQMTTTEKNSCSMRYNALELFKKYINPKAIFNSKLLKKELYN